MISKIAHHYFSFVMYVCIISTVLKRDTMLKGNTNRTSIDIKSHIVVCRYVSKVVIIGRYLYVGQFTHWAI